MSQVLCILSWACSVKILMVRSRVSAVLRTLHRIAGRTMRPVCLPRPSFETRRRRHSSGSGGEWLLKQLRLAEEAVHLIDETGYQAHLIFDKPTKTTFLTTDRKSV